MGSVPTEIWHLFSNHQEHHCTDFAKTSIDTIHNHCTFSHFQIDELFNESGFVLVLISVLLLCINTLFNLKKYHCLLYFSSNRGPPFID